MKNMGISNWTTEAVHNFVAPAAAAPKREKRLLHLLTQTRTKECVLVLELPTTTGIRINLGNTGRNMVIMIIMIMD